MERMDGWMVMEEVSSQLQSEHLLLLAHLMQMHPACCLFAAPGTKQCRKVGIPA